MKTSMKINLFAVLAAVLATSELSAAVLYGDAFSTNAQRIPGYGLSGAPEVNTTGTAVTYSGYAPDQFVYLNGATGAPADDAINMGASSGVLRLTRNDGADITALLPLPAAGTFRVGLDVVPFQGNQDAGGFVGLILANNVTYNYYQQASQVRIGISQSGGSSYQLAIEQNGGPSAYVAAASLAGFNSTGWNHLEAEFNLSANTVTAYFDGAWAATVSLNSLVNAQAVGFEAISGGYETSRSTYVDNFALAVPEPGICAMLMAGLGLSGMARRRRV